MKLSTACLCLASLAATSAIEAADGASPTAAEAYAIGQEAYVYFYPLVSMDVSRRLLTSLPAGVKTGVGPSNAFVHLRSFPTADFRDVVRPNFDTLYSTAWLDLRDGPVVVSAADTKGRYYLLPMLDMWSDAFAVPGSRTSGTAAASFAVVPPGWNGELPTGVQRIEAPTACVWIIGRTQTNGPQDYDAVHAVQDGYRITPLANGPAAPARAPDPPIDHKTPPLDQVNGMKGTAFLAYAAELLKVHPPHRTDWSVLARLKRIGLVPGSSFPIDDLAPEIRAELDRAAVDALKGMLARVPTMARVVDGWQMNTDSMGVYGNNYLKRAIVAMVGLGANQPEDAIYPMCVADAAGKPLQGGNRYVLRFAKEQLPPANAFWSVTMYDEAGFQVPNALNRFAIGDRDKLVYGSDGSLELYLQHDSPGAGKESNWLPAPAQGRLGVTMRLYSPRPEALDGRWAPPAVLQR